MTILEEFHAALRGWMRRFRATMIGVSLGKCQIRKQVERLNGVYVTVAGR